MKGLFKKISAAIVWVSFICWSCTHNSPPKAFTFPKHFNVQVPFRRDNKGIIISTYWGLANKEYQLYLDNHSPTWANDDIISNNPSASKSNDFLFSTTTADGKSIEGDVYLCDSISIGNLRFKNVLFYNISNKQIAGKSDGVIGENIMSEGIWKIDFRDNILTIASSVDSIKEMEQTILLPAVFTSKAIEVEAGFRNGIKKKVELDLGYNGYIMMSSFAFDSIAEGNKKSYKESRQISTPAGSANIEDISVSDSILIGQRRFNTVISTNQLVKESLIGLNFFSQFDFIIIDYVNKAVYISKK